MVKGMEASVEAERPPFRVSRRIQLIAIGGLLLVFAAAFYLLRPIPAPLSDEQYIAIAKNTPQGQLYFQHHNAPCQVVRGWQVQVSCDTVVAADQPAEKFRIYIDPRTNAIVDTDLQFNP